MVPLTRFAILIVALSISVRVDGEVVSWQTIDIELSDTAEQHTAVQPLYRQAAAIPNYLSNDDPGLRFANQLFVTPSSHFVAQANALRPLSAPQVAYQPPEPDVPGSPTLEEKSADLSSAPEPTADEAAEVDEPLGEAPEDNSLLFLRRSTPLLEPGRMAIDYGFRYSWREFPGLSLLPDGSLTTGRVRTRKLTHPLGIRYGLNRRTQLLLNVPVGLAILDRADIARQEATSVYGVGDISFGFNYLLQNGSGECPSVIAGFNVIAPTGAHPFEASPGPAALGSGFWGVGGSLFVIQQYDPAVVFGGVSYAHQFDRDYLGLTFDPGEIASWSLGAGFAVNSDVTFTSSFQGSYTAKLRANKRSIPNSAAEPMTLRFSLVLTGCKHRVIEPFVNVGLTPDAPDVDVGVVVTLR